MFAFYFVGNVLIPVYCKEYSFRSQKFFRNEIKVTEVYKWECLWSLFKV
jgi:hypothetical protein